MNKQIAIDILEKEKSYMQQHAGKAQVEAFDMAICALKISNKEIRDKAIADYQKGCVKIILNKRNEFVNEIQRRANNCMREAIVAETRTVSCYKTGIKEGLEEAVKVFDEIAEQMQEVE